jgi:hypothetical protein
MEKELIEEIRNYIQNCIKETKDCLQNANYIRCSRIVEDYETALLNFNDGMNTDIVREVLSDYFNLFVIPKYLEKTKK